METIQKWYDELVEMLGNKGESAFEDARFLLPNAAETKIIITMNARELLHFFRVRCCNRVAWFLLYFLLHNPGGKRQTVGTAVASVRGGRGNSGATAVGTGVGTGVCGGSTRSTITVTTLTVGGAAGAMG